MNESEKIVGVWGLAAQVYEDVETNERVQTMIAYTGRYRCENGIVRTKVEAAWNEAWVGTEQVRNLRFETDDLLHIVSDPMPHPNVPGRKVRVVVTWKREE
jgi:hypothetical protein